jgi:uncharacterized membrane-anchored protein YhcB (DUF1043 family)
MRKRSILAFILMVLLCTFINESYSFATGASKPLVTTAPTQQPQEMIQTNDSVNVEKLYEVLIQTKDDKILLMSNIVNWLLAIASILVGIIVVVFGWMLNKVKNQSNQAQNLIKRLTEKEEVINQTQSNIQNFLSSTEFQSKLSKLDEDIRFANLHLNRLIDEDTSRKNAEILERKRRLHFNIENGLKWFSEHNSMHTRIDNPLDLDKFDKIKNFNSLSTTLKNEWNMSDLENLHDEIWKLVHKYRIEGDFLV